MNFYIILSCYLLILIPLVFWGLKNLHKDNFQFFAVIPFKRLEENVYKGINITYYGIITSFANSFSILIFITLLRAIRFPDIGIYYILVIILLIGIPSSKILAYLIEKRKNTLTIGGAHFICGLLSIPITLIVLKITNQKTELLMPVLSALAISYTYGEGIGRLACLSFGCCYGKPAYKLKIPAFLTISFNSPTKKAVYDSQYKNIKLINVQGITVISYLLIATLSIFLFPLQKFGLAFLISFSIPALLRFLLEFLRHDFRGSSKVSVYQIFSAILSVYGVITYIFFDGLTFKIILDLNITYKYTDLLIILIAFMFTFFNSALSKVTGSNIRLYLIESGKY